jgi:hypothetical protein
VTTPKTTSETIPATNVERSFFWFMLPPFSRSISLCELMGSDVIDGLSYRYRARKQVVSRKLNRLFYARGASPVSQCYWFDSVIRHDACH